MRSWRAHYKMNHIESPAGCSLFHVSSVGGRPEGPQRILCGAKTFDKWRKRIIFDLNEPSTCGGSPGEVRPVRGMILLYGLFIFFPGKENEPKETARVPLFPARRPNARRTRKLASLRQVRALMPPAVSMLGAGQREKIHAPNRLTRPLEEGALFAHIHSFKEIRVTADQISAGRIQCRPRAGRHCGR